MYGFERNLWNTWQALERLQPAAFNAFQAAPWPAINILHNDAGAQLTAQLPGVDKDKLDISVRGATVVLSGNRQALDLGDDAACHRRESQPGSFKRQIELPFKVDASQVTAHFNLGELVVALPRAAEDRPQRITVSVAETAQEG